RVTRADAADVAVRSANPPRGEALPRKCGRHAPPGCLAAEHVPAHASSRIRLRISGSRHPRPGGYTPSRRKLRLLLAIKLRSEESAAAESRHPTSVDRILR